MADELVKIELRTGTGDDVRVETPWAVGLGENRYRLDNSPFWAYSLSWHDVVEALPQPTGHPLFSRVLEKSGHRTFRVRFDPPVAPGSAGQALLDHLVARGCSYEGMNPSYVSISVPPGLDLMTIADCLTTAGVDWEHADPRYDEIYSADTDR